jgi:hypothetical protein
LLIKPGEKFVEILRGSIIDTSPLIGLEIINKLGDKTNKLRYGINGFSLGL